MNMMEATDGVMAKSGSEVQADRAAAAIAISENQAEMAAQMIALEQQKLAERAKLMKYAGIGAGVLVLYMFFKGK